jgi:hypothetical protein
MISDSDEPGLSFRRSSFCGVGGCVEVAAQPDGEILVRDGKDLSSVSPVLRFTQIEWDAFLTGVAAGEFAPDALSVRS